MTLSSLRPAASRCLAVVLRRDKLRDSGLRVCLNELEQIRHIPSVTATCPANGACDHDPAESRSEPG
jgi:hypothetical protein